VPGTGYDETAMRAGVGRRSGSFWRPDMGRKVPRPRIRREATLRCCASRTNNWTSPTPFAKPRAT